MNKQTENTQENKRFNYTYSAKAQTDINQIRKKYLSVVDKMEQLRRLDAGVTEKATGASIVMGVISTLLLGLGIYCVMVWQGLWFAPGILFGLIGTIGVTAAYPIYQRVIQTDRNRIAPVILRLTEELMK